jgi:ABC-type cobalamin/Fe3+-siderophores transport system ATPase subunit
MVNALEARALAHTYADGPRALDGVDFTLSAGELVVVIGPNGSGKSTLLSILAGLLRPTAGEVRLRGREIAQWSPRERARHVAVVPQFLPALPDLRVADFVLGACPRCPTCVSPISCSADATRTSSAGSTPRRAITKRSAPRSRAATPRTSRSAR